MRLSLIDFASAHEGQTAAQTLEASVRLAQRADESGRFERIWYTEHHNMPSIVSSAPPVLIAHIAAKTESIRLGAGGVMLPNHAPLVVAEQFGTLAELHPGRIDLGLGRAPGTDQVTLRALRRDPRSSERFPQDVVELRDYLSESGDHEATPGIHAHPGIGTKVPLYILGSSLFGAQLAAALGLPYSFASHFAPGALEHAVRVYREEYQPSSEFPEPYVIAAANAVAADSMAEAQEIQEQLLRGRLRALVAQNPTMRGRTLTDDEVDALMDSPTGHQVRQMQTYAALGTSADLGEWIERFAVHADADEVMLAPNGTSSDQQLATVDALAKI